MREFHIYPFYFDSAQECLFAKDQIPKSLLQAKTLDWFYLAFALFGVNVLMAVLAWSYT